MAQTRLFFMPQTLIDLFEGLSQIKNVLVFYAHWTFYFRSFNFIGGYGSKTLNILRCFRNQCVPVTSELPLIPGRDFSGTIVEVGPSVQNYKPGDEVILFMLF